MTENEEPQPTCCRKALPRALSWLPKLGLILGIVLLPG